MRSNSVDYDFNGCAVLVTGGSNGIGNGIARAFAEAGAAVTVTGRKPSPSDYASDLSGFEYRQLEMTDHDGIERVAGALPRLDVLVNNAGANLPGGRNEYEPDVFEEVVDVNLFGAYRMAAACKDKLAASDLVGGASVVNFASMSAFMAVPIVPAYGAAKAAVVQMTKNLAVAWVGEGIRVNAVAPGLVESNMTAAMKGIDALERPQMERTPMRRWGTPADIAGAVLFLCSSGARFITGQTINVDGGYSAN
jgi:NAD(P)-dependent dehydrogenase (short-subunit alcohol dehydrogenase family)